MRDTHTEGWRGGSYGTVAVYDAGLALCWRRAAVAKPHASRRFAGRAAVHVVADAWRAWTRMRAAVGMRSAAAKTAAGDASTLRIAWHAAPGQPRARGGAGAPGAYCGECAGRTAHAAVSDALLPRRRACCGVRSGEEDARVRRRAARAAVLAAPWGLRTTRGGCGKVQQLSGVCNVQLTSSH